MNSLFEFDGGSSPHTRGAPVFQLLGAFLAGIIPAYAGSTSHQRLALSSNWDHPRIRGEHVDRVDQQVVDTGSSPHTRGARRPASVPDIRPRIIPAYAGSTRWAPAARRRSRDHPRIRGEHHASASFFCLRRGSSPHTRGAQVLDHRVLDEEGIIPAYAGSTSCRP